MTYAEELYENVQSIYDRFGDRIKNDQHLLVLYWKYIDGVSINKDSISVNDFINKATSAKDIMNTKLLIDTISECRRGEEWDEEDNWEDD